MKNFKDFVNETQNMTIDVKWPPANVKNEFNLKDAKTKYSVKIKPYGYKSAK